MIASKKCWLVSEPNLMHSLVVLIAGFVAGCLEMYITCCISATSIQQVPVHGRHLQYADSCPICTVPTVVGIVVTEGSFAYQ